MFAYVVVIFCVLFNYLRVVLILSPFVMIYNSSMLPHIRHSVFVVVFCFHIFALCLLVFVFNYVVVFVFCFLLFFCLFLSTWFVMFSFCCLFFFLFFCFMLSVCFSFVLRIFIVCTASSFIIAILL